MKLNLHDLDPVIRFHDFYNGKVIEIEIWSNDTVHVQTGYIEVQWDE